MNSSLPQYVEDHEKSDIKRDELLVHIVVGGLKLALIVLRTLGRH